MNIHYHPLVDVSLVRMLHDRWYAAYDYHAQRLIDAECDKQCKMRQRRYMSAALRRTVVCGIHYMHGLAAQAECREAMINTLIVEYTQALGLNEDMITYVERDVRMSAFEQSLMQVLIGETLLGEN